jgi:phosphoglycolate phosphatase
VAAGRPSRPDGRAPLADGAPPAFPHVAFDLDGTLLDTRADLAAATNHVLRTLGRAPIPPETVFGLVGEGGRRLVEKALGDADEALVERGVAVFMAWYGEHCLDATVPYPGMVEALDALADAGCALTVLTNKPEGLSRKILAGLGLEPRFAAVVGGDTLPTRKPDPAGLAWLCARTATPAPRTLLVGDSGIDVRTARAAGAGFCGVAWGLTPDGMYAAGPERVIDAPAALVDVVRGRR